MAAKNFRSSSNVTSLWCHALITTQLRIYSSKESPAQLMARQCSEPSARSAFFSSPVGGKVYLWGGYNQDLLSKKISLKEFTESVYSFDPYQEIWTSLSPTGPPPAGTSNGACTSTDHHIYTYGGWDRDGTDGCLHSLNAETLAWNKLASNGPMKKNNCGMIAYDNQLLLFGGYGVPSGPTQPGSAFVRDVSDHGWTNELHTFDLSKGEVLSSQ